MTAAPLATVPPACWSPHPSLARLTPPDRSGVGARIVLLRFEGACAGPTVLSAVGTRPPHDGSSSEPAFQCGSRGPRAAATKSTEPLLPLAPADQHLVRGGLESDGEPEEALEGGGGRAASIEAKHELVEVALEVRPAQPVVDAETPPLHVGEHPVHPRQHQVGRRV